MFWRGGCFGGCMVRGVVLVVLGLRVGMGLSDGLGVEGLVGWREVFGCSGW